MHCQSLVDVPLDELHATFLEAFSDYLIPMFPSTERFARKLKADGFDPALSAGVMVDGRLAGFILNSIGTWQGKKTAYNGGTGVVPAQRGRHFTQLMYEWLRPHLQAAHVEQCLLEVLTPNLPALRSYKNSGFRTERTLACFQGWVQPPAQLPSGGKIEALSFDRWPTLAAWQATPPAWQNHADVLVRAPDQREIWGLYHQNDLIGGAMYIPETNQVAQLAIRPDRRRQGWGTFLMLYLGSLRNEPLRVLNVDRRHPDAISFLESLGLTVFIDQYEMRLTLA
ncbi:Acetyltransferase (GNAT) family protein [Catalinimonas alkaloidigena]|uniref:Acetyltransferase (GNAT) family protein n=1 Tax=Catalinimonas alkaloidigena TaxID=1075417 RepID=A0A1G9PP22_9BACT|nr:GNAT family N-acetyltransferase [Catalinimonas alkaloidigena]SDM00474.1 Acetyltransferase (GNAT) family protein [Catalinimonas alkaloidigena]